MQAKFNKLVSEWKKGRGPTSLIRKMAAHPAYQKIIKMGEDAIPLILKEMEREPDHWFWALVVLTNANPVSERDRGKLDKMTKAWLDWGRKHRYI